MEMKGAQILIECLINEGVDTLFGYPGGYVIDIFDALYLARGRIRQVLTCHEQGAAHAADGYARTSGKVGVCIATSGPGATNLVTGIANAYMDSVPMVAITGNVPLSSLGRDSFQEVDIAGVTMPVTKYNYIVKDIKDLAPTVAEAFTLARSGRPGPVLVDIPKNVQQAIYEYTPIAPSTLPCPPVDAAELAVAVELLKKSQKPLVYVGGGVVSSGATAELIDFAERIDAPVSSSMMGLGGFPASHPLFTGMIGMHGHAGVAKTLSECDLVVAIGARFSDRVAGDRQNFARHAKVLHIDIDEAEIDKNVASAAHVVGDIKAILNALNGALAPAQKTAWTARVAAHMASYQYKDSAQALDPRVVLRAINAFNPPNGIVATDVGQHQMWTAQTYRFECPRTFVTSGGLGTMGFGMGAAIGASLGRNRARVALITGDGSFHMNFNEVVTAVKERLPIAIFLFNNGTLGMVRQWQKLFYKQHYSSTTLDLPTNYRYLAQAFGADYYELDRNEDVRRVVAAAMACESPVIVNCRLDIDENVLPMIPPGKSCEDIITDLKD